MYDPTANPTGYLRGTKDRKLTVAEVCEQIRDIPGPGMPGWEPPNPDKDIVPGLGLK